MNYSLNRRTALKHGLAALALGPTLVQMTRPMRAFASVSAIGPLGPADANDIRLPAGFQSRVVAASNTNCAGGPDPMGDLAVL